MTEQELARGAARRLAIIRHAQEVTGNVAGTCRYSDAEGETAAARNKATRRRKSSGRRNRKVGAKR